MQTVDLWVRFRLQGWELQKYLEQSALCSETWGFGSVDAVLTESF